MNQLKDHFSVVEGGIPAIASACGVSVRAVYKWIQNNRLPRTDYTEETKYAATIALLPGAKVTADDLLKKRNSSE